FEGIYKYDLSGKLLFNWKFSNQPIPFYNGNIRFIIPKNDSVLWIGNAEEQGLAVLNMHTNQVSVLKTNENDPSSLISNSLLAVHIDKDGNEWIGTFSGISKLNNTALSVKKWETGTPNSNYPFM